MYFFLCFLDSNDQEYINHIKKAFAFCIYCRSGNIQEILIFANFSRKTNSRKNIAGIEYNRQCVYLLILMYNWAKRYMFVFDLLSF